VSKRLNNFIGAAELRHLAGAAKKLTALQQQYKRLVPAALSRASHVERLEGPTLVLAADNGASAAKLRQLAPELVRQFRSGGCEIAAIQVKVQVSVVRPKRAAVPRKLPARGRAALEALSENLPDSPLKRSLARFAAKSC
jgi:hypothetical protein